MKKHKLISTTDIYSLIRQNEEDINKVKRIKRERDANYNPYPNGWNRIDFMKDFLKDKKVDGFVMSYPHGTVIKQAEKSFYYRGENQIYENSTPTLFRKLDTVNDHDEATVEEFVAYLRMSDFLNLILKFDHTQHYLSPRSFKGKPVYIDLLYEQIAQHYGIDTPWLDITSDFDIALFFACCKFSQNSQKWEPLSYTDINHNVDTEFGVLFRRRASIPIIDKLPFAQIFPVGYQPFMRCHMQSSYVAQMNKNDTLQNDPSFEELRFKHSEKLSNYIYEKMEGGNKVYPQEGLNKIAEEIQRIKEKRYFTIETFEDAYNNTKIDFPEKYKLKKLLVKYGYDLVEASEFIPHEKIEAVNEEYKDFDFVKTFGIKISGRLFYKM